MCIQMNDYESQAYDFFRFQTINQLPGSSWSLSWQRLALETGHTEPAITHAAIALGSIHRAMSAQKQPGTADIDHDQHHFALSQYSKALGIVRRYIDTLTSTATSHDVEVVLLVSLMFFCFGILHGEDARATLHLRTGLRILYERVRRLDQYRSVSSYANDAGKEGKRVVRMQTRPRTNMDVLLQTFVRLDGDLTIIGAEEPFLFPVCNERIPMVFYTMEEAMVHLDTLATAAHSVHREMVLLADSRLAAERPGYTDMDEDMRNCLACAYSRVVPMDTAQERRLEKVKDDVKAWMSALASLPISHEKKSTHLLTQIHFFYTWFTTLSWRDGDEMQVDRFDGQFAHILSLAEQYINMQGELAPEMKTEPQSYPLTRQAFTVGTDVMTCIAMIGFKSRSSSIRRRAIKLLRDINLAGVFGGHYLAAFTQFVVDMEEARARAINGISKEVDLKCEQVPLEARFIEIELSPTKVEEREGSSYMEDTGRLIYAMYTGPEPQELVIQEATFDVNPHLETTGSKQDLPMRCCNVSEGGPSSKTGIFSGPNNLSISAKGKMEVGRGEAQDGVSF